MSTKRTGVSESGCVARIRDVDCETWTRLLGCDPEVGMDFAFAAYSDVEPVVSKTVSFQRAARDSVCPVRGGGLKPLGWIMGSCPEVHYETMPDV